MSAADQFARVLAMVSSHVERKADHAKAELHAMVVRDRRSLGQRARWANYRERIVR